MIFRDNHDKLHNYKREYSKNQQRLIFIIKEYTNQHRTSNDAAWICWNKHALWNINAKNHSSLLGTAVYD